MNLEFQYKKKKLPTKQGNLSDNEEHRRILMQYAGIFPHAVKEFAEKLPKMKKVVKNYSR